MDPPRSGAGSAQYILWPARSLRPQRVAIGNKLEPPTYTDVANLLNIENSESCLGLIRSARTPGTSDWAQVLHCLEHLHNVVAQRVRFAIAPVSKKQFSAGRAQSSGALQAAKNIPWQRAVGVLIPIAISRSDTSEP